MGVSGSRGDRDQDRVDYLPKRYDLFFDFLPGLGPRRDARVGEHPLDAVSYLFKQFLAPRVL